MRDLVSYISAATLLAPATYAADSTPVAVSLRGFRSAAILLHIGAGGITFDATNKVEFKLEHSDASGSGWAAVAQADVQGVTVGTGGIVESLIAAHSAATITEVGYVGGKEFVRMTADFSGTHGTGTPMSAMLVRSSPYSVPI